MQTSSYAIDWDRPVTTAEDASSVSVPSLEPISNEVQSTIQQQLAVHTDEMFGLEHYVITREALS